jgi:glycosyltransferase involved in cell wall biosynthesis
MKKRNRPLLSICIPTFNRASSLERLMECISLQVAKPNGTVEICISDNCSSDQTRQVAEKWSEKLPIRYNRNKANLGYDGNILALLSMAKGSFAWIMGDDDVFEPGAIMRVAQDVPLAAKKKAGAIYINACDRFGPYAKCGFGDFRIFSKNRADYPPLNVSFMGSICLDAALAREIMKGVSIVDGKLIKNGKDITRLHEFLHSYMFLECLSCREFFGIEPNVGVRRMKQASSTGCSSYERWLFMDLILLMYPLQVRNYYPWFSDGSVHYDMRGHLVRTAIVSMRPDFEKPYLACLALYLKLLELNGKTGEAAAVKAYERVRKNAICRMAVASAFKMATSILKARIVERNEGSEYYKKMIGPAMLRAEEMLCDP